MLMFSLCALPGIITDVSDGLKAAALCRRCVRGRTVNRSPHAQIKSHCCGVWEADYFSESFTQVRVWCRRRGGFHAFT